MNVNTVKVYVNVVGITVTTKGSRIVMTLSVLQTIIVIYNANKEALLTFKGDYCDIKV